MAHIWLQVVFSVLFFFIYLDALSFVLQLSDEMVIISVFWFFQNSVILILSSCDPSFPAKQSFNIISIWDYHHFPT